MIGGLMSLQHPGEGTRWNHCLPPRMTHFGLIDTASLFAVARLQLVAVASPDTAI